MQIDAKFIEQFKEDLENVNLKEYFKEHRPNNEYSDVAQIMVDSVLDNLPENDYFFSKNN